MFIMYIYIEHMQPDVFSLVESILMKMLIIPVIICSSSGSTAEEMKKKKSSIGDSEQTKRLLDSLAVILARFIREKHPPSSSLN